MGKLNTDGSGMSKPMLQSSPFENPPEADLEVQVDRLHRLTVWGRWAVVLGLWVTIGPLSLWGLRHNISLWLEHFTWAAVRVGLRYNFWASIGLAVCLGCTFAVLLWQSRNILFGLSKRDRKLLIAQVLRIREQGQQHPLWKWVCHRPTPSPQAPDSDFRS